MELVNNYKSYYTYFPMFKNLKKISNMLSRDMEGSEKQLELLDLKSTTAMVKNTLDRFNSRLDTTEERNSKVKYTVIATIQNETHGRKKVKSNMNRASVSYETTPSFIHHNPIGRSTLIALWVDNLIMAGPVTFFLGF